MNIVIVANVYPVCSARYVADALERQGHAVRVIGKRYGTFIPWHGGFDVDEQHAWTPEEPDKRFKPDVVLIMDSAAQLDAQLYDGVPHVVYGVDNHVRDYAGVESVADHFFLAHGNGARMGDDNVTHLACGFDPVHFTPGVKWEDREYDAAMIGVHYDSRAEWLYTLRRFRPNWRMLYDLRVYDAYTWAYQNSKISLVRSAKNDVAQRVWETAAMGCLVLKDRNHDDEALGLENWKNCLIYDNDQHARDLIIWTENNPAKAAKIAREGMKWAQSGTWDERVKVIVEWVQAQGAESGKK
jgi:hypothetical protein